MGVYDLGKFVRTAKAIYARAEKEGRLIANPSRDEMRRLSEQEPGVVITKYGNISADSEPTSRAAMFTENSVDHPFGDEEDRLLEQCEQVLAKEEIIALDRVVGDGTQGITVRALIPKRFAHLAYAGDRLFGYSDPVEDPTYTLVFYADEFFEPNKSKPLPEKDVSVRLAFLPDGHMVKICRNSNYFGEYKKGVFAAEDWNTKVRRGGIFLHAGCREDILQNVHGDYVFQRSLLVALSANGKTSTTCKVLARKGQERSWLVQDDGGALMPDGSFRGFEAGGIFAKTDGLNPADQIETYYGVFKHDTYCENICINEDGTFDFFNSDKTSNGRAVICRRDFMHASHDINVDHIDNLILITRGPSVPAISKLSAEEAAAFMLLGQAMESSAGDPTQAGRIKSVFFYDPFVAGDRAEHVNIFYDIIKAQKNMSFYLINTGGVGEGEHYHDITLGHTMGILDSLLRGGLEDWELTASGFRVCKAVRSVDSILMHPDKLYSKAEFNEKREAVNKLRLKAIEAVGGGLHPKIRQVFLD